MTNTTIPDIDVAGLIASLFQAWGMNEYTIVLDRPDGQRQIRVAAESAEEAAAPWADDPNLIAVIVPDDEADDQPITITRPYHDPGLPAPALPLFRKEP